MGWELVERLILILILILISLVRLSKGFYVAFRVGCGCLELGIMTWSGWIWD
jgi:hypothetical protein